MARATATVTEKVPAEALREPGPLMGALWRELELEDLRAGSWFTKLVTLWLRHEQAQGQRERLIGRSPQALEAVIRRASAQAALSGAGAATVATWASVYAAQSGGVGALVALPVAGLAVGGEMLVRVLVHLQLARELAAAFGVHFRPEQPEDLSQLYALVFGTEQHEDAMDPGRDLVHRLMHKDMAELGSALGKKLMGESAMRNLLPFANVGTSAIANVRRTRQLGEVVVGYARARRVLEAALEAVRRADASAVELLLESVWFLFTADGRLRHEEAALLAYLLRQAPAGVRGRVLERMVVDESDWMRRLGGMPERLRALFFHALCAVSASDLEAPPPERQVLERAAQALGRTGELRQLVGMMERLRTGGELPEPPAVSPPRAARGPGRPRTRERQVPAPH